MTRRWALLAVPAVLILAGCAPAEGIVVERDYHPPRKECIKTTCKHKPEQWQLRLDHGRDPCVPKTVWDAHPAGSRWVDDGTATYWGCGT